MRADDRAPWPRWLQFFNACLGVVLFWNWIEFGYRQLAVVLSTVLAASSAMYVLTYLNNWDGLRDWEADRGKLPWRLRPLAYGWPALGLLVAAALLLLAGLIRLAVER